MSIQIKKHSRWAAWGDAILNKVARPDKCQRLIRQRQNDVDDDQDESDLVVEEIRRQFRRVGRDPDNCQVFIRAKYLSEWVYEATGERITPARVSGYLRALNLSELKSQKRKSRGAGWIWKGGNCKVKKTEDYDQLLENDFHGIP